MVNLLRWRTIRRRGHFNPPLGPVPSLRMWHCEGRLPEFTFSITKTTGIPTNRQNPLKIATFGSDYLPVHPFSFKINHRKLVYNGDKQRICHILVNTMETITSNRGKKLFVINNFTFRKDKSVSAGVSYRCCADKCTARLLVDAGETKLLKESGVHYHDPVGSDLYAKVSCDILLTLR